jgi:hypothetical protein
MKTLLIPSALILAAAGLSACSTMSGPTDFVNPNTNKVVARVWEGKNASNPMAPSTAALYMWDAKNGVKVAGYVGGATPLEQVVPLASAGIAANGAIQAAKAIKPDNINNSSESSSTATALSWSEVRVHLTQQQIANYAACQPVIYGGFSYQMGGCGS